MNHYRITCAVLVFSTTTNRLVCMPAVPHCNIIRLLFIHLTPSRHNATVNFPPCAMQCHRSNWTFATVLLMKAIIILFLCRKRKIPWEQQNVQQFYRQKFLRLFSNNLIIFSFIYSFFLSEQWNSLLELFYLIRYFVCIFF